jgi:hypothetical protein
MTQIDDIRTTYTRLLDEETTTREKLAKAKDDLETAHDADVQAAADAALAGDSPPKRSEVRLRHAIENLSVTLAGIDAAHAQLLDVALTATGEGRRELTGREQQDLRNFIIPKVTDAQRRDAWATTGQVASPDLRPEDLIEFVTKAYDASDKVYEENREARRKKEGYDVAIKHIQDAKQEHVRRGKDPRDFQIESYPEIVSDEDLTFLSSAPGRGAFQNASTGADIPWPGSIQDLQANTEPSSTPA